MSRYIDADKLYDDLTKIRINLMQEGVDITPIWQALDCVLQQPTADVRENVRGEWVIVVDKTEMCDKEGVKTWGSLCQCNKCGFVLNAVEGHIGQYNFCPNCGADMRGDI